MKRFLTNLLLLVLLSITKVQTWATETSPSSGPRFGPEFTFTSFGDLNNRDGLAQYLLNLEAHLVEGQSEGQKFQVVIQQNANPDNPAARNRFKSPNGWQFHAKSDEGVIEVTMAPMLVEEYEKYEENIQDAIFQTAYNLDFFAALFGGGGHINMDAEYFADNPLFFRNFIVDMLNHNELSLGIFNYDTHNAIPIEMLSERAVLLIQDAIRKFDESPGGVQALKKFIGQVNDAMMYSYDPFMAMWGDFPEPARYKMTALNLGKVGHNSYKFGRIELRSVRAQMDMDVWIRQIRLLRNRVLYLETLKEPIPYKPSFELSFIRDLASSPSELKAFKLNPPVEAQEALQAFKKFVEESGENIEDHLDYVWPQWITDGEVQTFKEGLCNSLLEAGA